VAESGESFDVLELAATVGVLSDRELARWLLAEGLARPNGAVGKLELTEEGVDRTIEGPARPLEFGGVPATSAVGVDDRVIARERTRTRRPGIVTFGARLPRG
jgi:hypothetical protein